MLTDKLLSLRDPLRDPATPWALPPQPHPCNMFGQTLQTTYFTKSFFSLANYISSLLLLSPSLFLLPYIHIQLPTSPPKNRYAHQHYDNGLSNYISQLRDPSKKILSLHFLASQNTPNYMSYSCTGAKVKPP